MLPQIRVPYFLRVKEGVKSRIPHLLGLRYRLDCFFENMFIRLALLPKEGTSKKACDAESITLSLTTYPARLDSCYYAIKSLMLQSVKANRIILWLSKSQFDKVPIPKKYNKLIKRGLEICYCDEDLKGHKKYFYILSNQKNNELVITYDDDIIYDRNSVKRLLLKHRSFPKAIVCDRAHEILKKNNKLDSIDKWRCISDDAHLFPHKYMLPSTGGGCLYPYKSLPMSTFDTTLLKKCALNQDDLWICFNMISFGTQLVKTKHKNAIFVNVFKSQKTSLTYENDICGENNKAIERLEKVFPDIFND